MSETEEREEEHKVMYVLPPQQSKTVVTPSQIAWGLVAVMLLIATAATVTMACWNELAPLTGAPTMDWGQALAGVILLKLASILLLPMRKR